MSLTRREFLRGAVAIGGSWVLLGRTAGALDEVQPAGEWLAGDLHTHTVYSTDVSTKADAAAAGTPGRLGFTPAEQIRVAESRGLDFLAITDHGNTYAQRDPGYASAALVLVPGYEASVGEHGHVGVLGVPRWIRIDVGRRDAPSKLKREVLRRGGLFIPTHPFSGSRPWQPARRVRPHALEIWNGSLAYDTTLRSIRTWDDEWLVKARLPIVGGSDFHHVARLSHNGPGQPTTWVRARDRSWRAILAGIKAGRTSISADPPGLGGVRLLMEADDGNELASIGDAVPRARLGITVGIDGARASVGGPWAVRLIVDGAATPERQLASGDERVTWAVRPRRYVRAELIEGDPPRLAALTSPIWVRRP